MWIDGGGLVDFPADPGCASPTDPSERSTALVCDDGLDNDGDGFVDHPADPGCASAASRREYAMCQDGIDNEGDGTLDFDGGASVNGGVALGPPDPKCIHPYDDREIPSCGFGAELTLVLGALGIRRRRLRTDRA